MAISNRVLLTLLAIAGVVGSTHPCLAGDPNFVGIAGNTKSDSKEIKTDFHITLSSDTNMTFQYAYITINGGKQIAPTAPPKGDGTEQISLDWTGFAFDNTDAVHWYYSVSEDRENKIIPMVYFTPKQSPTDVPTLGWNVTDGGDVYLLNGSASAIHFSNLLFQEPVTITNTTLLDLLDVSPSGMTGLVSSGDVPAVDSGGTPGQLLVGKFSLQPGSFLTSTMDTSFTDSSFSQITQTEALGHEHPVPEPGTLALLFGAGIPGAAFLMRRRTARH